MYETFGTIQYSDDKKKCFKVDFCFWEKKLKHKLARGCAQSFCRF